MQMMHDPPGGRIMHHLHDPPSDALLRFAHSCSFAALSRRPSLRSARGCATRQASPAVSLSLKPQASPAARRGHVFYLATNDAKTKHSAATKKKLTPVDQQGGGWCLTCAF